MHCIKYECWTVTVKFHLKETKVINGAGELEADVGADWSSCEQLGARWTSTGPPAGAAAVHCLLHPG